MEWARLISEYREKIQTLSQFSGTRELETSNSNPLAILNNRSDKIQENVSGRCAVPSHYGIGAFS